MLSSPNALVRRRVLILVLLAVVAYLPILSLPFIDDDYAEITMGGNWAATGWAPLFQNPHLRTRTTNMVLDGWLDHIFGFTPVPFYIVSILVHVLCVLLVFASSAWTEVIDETTAFWAACFFAIFEGHQEAVMWISARNESLVFLFGMSAWLCWVKYLHGRGAVWYGLAIASFLLAGASKESFVVFPVLMLLPCLWLPQGTTRRAALAAIAPFFAIVLAYLAWMWLGQRSQPRTEDIRFSVGAPWPLVIAKSFWRMMFISGIVALAILWWTRQPANWRRIAFALSWMVLAIVPYSFLTYMPQIASRHTYIASAGLAVLVGTAAMSLWKANHRLVLGILSAVMLLLNVEIIWVKKMSQFRDRAEPAVLLTEAARNAAGPIIIRCMPFSDYVTESVLATGGRRAVFPPSVTHDDHCFVIEYQNSAGTPVQVNRRVRTKAHGLLY